MGGVPVVMCRVVSLSQPRMDQYFNMMEKIFKERKTTSRSHFILQDVLDLRRVIIINNTFNYNTLIG